jgi:hypothetical protein
MKENNNPELKGFCAEIPFQSWIATKEAWKKANPYAVIKEEMKSVYMGIAEVPDSQLIGRTTQVKTMMIAWAIVYTEPKKVITAKP